MLLPGCNQTPQVWVEDHRAATDACSDEYLHCIKNQWAAQWCAGDLIFNPNPQTLYRLEQCGRSVVVFMVQFHFSVTFKKLRYEKKLE